MSEPLNVNCDSNDFFEGGIRMLNETEFIKNLLNEENILSYEPDVVTHLSDFMQDYIAKVLEHSMAFMKHAGRNNLELSDVKLALNLMQKKRNANKRLSLKELLNLAKEHNKTKVLHVREQNGLPIPADSLNKCNYKMRNLNSKPLFSQTPMVDLTNWQSQFVSSEVKKHQSKMQPSPCTNIPQKIVVKPQFHNLNTVYLKQMRIESSMNDSQYH